jgi:hypothetical protein
MKMFTTVARIYMCTSTNAAYEVLKPKGQLAFITTNKFMRARYGAGLKTFLATQYDPTCVD